MQQMPQKSRRLWKKQQQKSTDSKSTTRREEAAGTAQIGDKNWVLQLDRE